MRSHSFARDMKAAWRVLRSATLHWLILFSIGFLLAGCAAISRPRELPERLQYQGFSVGRPPSTAWQLDAKHQTQTSMIYARTVSGRTHSVMFSVELSAFAREPASDEEFAALVRDRTITVTDPERWEVISYEAHPETRQGQFCVRYVARTIDHKSPVLPGLDLDMSFDGRACRHPSWPEAVVDAYVSERAIPSELDPNLGVETEQLLDSVIIEVAPGVPAK